MTLELSPGPAPADDPRPQDPSLALPPGDPGADHSTADPLTATPDTVTADISPAAADPTAMDGSAAPAPVSLSPPNAGFGNEPAKGAPPRPVLRALQPPDDAALDNARRGVWVMNENHDGWVLLGADRKPVMHKDRSRVSFRFRDAARLAQELAPSDETDVAAVTDPVPLAPLDSGYNRDWDPQAQKSFLADITKACRLLAYQYVRFTEPQEAVRRAVSDNRTV